MQQRDSYYDILRGIAITFVIAIHTYPPLLNRHLFYITIVQNHLQFSYSYFSFLI